MRAGRESREALEGHARLLPARQSWLRACSGPMTVHLSARGVTGEGCTEATVLRDDLSLKHCLTEFQNLGSQ